jgi:hypothetical protein
MGGLGIVWLLTVRMSSVQPTAYISEDSARVKSSVFTSAQAPFVFSAQEPVRFNPQPIEAQPIAPTVSVAPRVAQSLSTPLSTESVTHAASGTSKSGIARVASHVSEKPANISSTGFAALTLPALSVEADTVSLSTLPLPAVMAATHTALSLNPVQKAGLETIADDFSEKAGEPPVDGSEDARATFAVNAYIVATEADFLIRQRYGHRAYVQMQMEAHRASFAR